MATAQVTVAGPTHPVRRTRTTPFPVSPCGPRRGVSGWAVGSLIMAEKVLQAELGMAKPKWLAQSW